MLKTFPRFDDIISAFSAIKIFFTVRYRTVLVPWYSRIQDYWDLRFYFVFAHLRTPFLKKKKKFWFLRYGSTLDTYASIFVGRFLKWILVKNVICVVVPYHTVRLKYKPYLHYWTFFFIKRDVYVPTYVHKSVILSIFVEKNSYAIDFLGIKSYCYKLIRELKYNFCDYDFPSYLIELFVMYGTYVLVRT